MAAKVPVVEGEIGSVDCTAKSILPLLNWSDAHGVSYLAWAWNVGSCRGEPSLITSYDGTPTRTYGQGYRFIAPIERVIEPARSPATEQGTPYQSPAFRWRYLWVFALGVTGHTAIYTVPASGGTPKRITPLTPSYMHSWSPDGKTLVYTAQRNNEFDIYAAAADGSGSERRRTVCGMPAIAPHCGR